MKRKKDKNKNETKEKKRNKQRVCISIYSSKLRDDMCEPGMPPSGICFCSGFRTTRLMMMMIEIGKSFLTPSVILFYWLSPIAMAIKSPLGLHSRTQKSEED